LVLSLDLAVLGARPAPVSACNPSSMQSICMRACRHAAYVATLFDRMLLLINFHPIGRVRAEMLLLLCF
jgi:hypothetical protein